MPVLNSARYLTNAVQSILKQTLGAWELILIDGGSTDGSITIEKTYEGTDARVKIILQKSRKPGRRGLPQALNLGIEGSSGEYIARMDSDDVCDPTRLEKQVTVMDEQNEVGVCYTGGWTLDEAGRYIAPMRNRLGALLSPLRDVERGDVFRALLRRNFIIGSSVVIRRSTLGDDRFDESAISAEDWDLSVRLARRTPFRSIPELLYGYRIHDEAGSGPQYAFRNAYGLVKNMMKWTQTIEMDQGDRRRLFLTMPIYLLATPYDIVRRGIGRY